MKTREELQHDAARLGLNLNYMPKCVIENIFERGEKEWQETMNNGIGSSGASAAIGQNPYKSRAEVALEKVMRRSKPIALGNPDKQYMLDCGHQMEAALLKWYAAKLGYVCALADPDNPSTSDILDVSEISLEMWEKWEGKGVVCVDHARYAHPEYSFMFTDMDGVVFTPEREMYVAECKTTSLDNASFKWNWKGGVWGEGASVGNSSYIDQARHHMCVANADRCDIIITNGFNAASIEVITVYRDIEEEKKIIDSERALWLQVEDGEIPSFMTLSERRYENIAYIVIPEKRDPEPIEMDPSMLKVTDEIFNLKFEISEREEEIRRREERINALNIDLIRAMEGHSVAVLPSNSTGKEIKIEVKQTFSTRLDEDKFKLTEPDRFSEYEKYMKLIKKEYEDKKEEYIKPIKEEYSKVCGGDAKVSVKEVKARSIKKGA